TCKAGVCTGGQPVTCDPCETCDVAAGGCVIGPRPTCRVPVESEASKLKVKDSPKGQKSDQLQWKWTKGQATSLAEFGDPVTTDGLDFCLFDRSQAPASLLFRASVAR